MKTDNFDQVDPVSVLGFFTIFLLVRGVNYIHESTVIWDTPHCVPNHPNSFVNSRMVQSDRTESIKITANFYVVTLQPPLLRSYPEAVNHLLKRCAHDEAIAGNVAAILRFTRPASVTLLQYSEALFDKPIGVGDIYDDCRSNDTLSEENDGSARRSLRENSTTYPPIDLIVLKSQA